MAALAPNIMPSQEIVVAAAQAAHTGSAAAKWTDGEYLAQVTRVAVAGGCIALANVHCSHPADADELRLQQLKQVYDAWRALRGCHAAIGGALNAGPGDPPLAWPRGREDLDARKA